MASKDRPITMNYKITKKLSKADIRLLSDMMDAVHDEIHVFDFRAAVPLDFEKEIENVLENLSPNYKKLFLRILNSPYEDLPLYINSCYKDECEEPIQIKETDSAYVLIQWRLKIGK